MLPVYLFLSLTLLKAQSVTGTVTSLDDKQPLPFVTVVENGTNNVVTTGVDGRYSINVKSLQDTLVFSFVGYVTQRIAINNRTAIDVQLKLSSQEINEVVVTALGINRQKRELGYSTEKIDGGSLRQSDAPNIINAITGKAAGVQVTNPDGVDGGTTRITIRGNNSINGNNQPLIVVDGVPMNNDPGLTDVGRGRDWGSAINNINMDDVEDINILKGGAASALYGSRGANGVILITMKKGRKQKGLGISYNMSYKLTTPYRYRDVQNVYGGGAPNPNLTEPVFALGPDSVPLYPILSTDAQFGYPGSSVSWGPKMNGQMIRWWDGEMRPWSPIPDNLQIPFNNGTNITHSIAAEGGGDVGTMRVSVSHTSNTPIVDNSNYNQTSINTNSTLKISDRVSLGLSVAYTDYHRLNSPMLGEDAQSFNKGLLYSWPRNYFGEDLLSYQNADGTRNPQEGYPYLYIDKYLWWNYYNNNTTLDCSKLLGSVSLKYNITSWLSLEGRTGLDLTYDEFVTKRKPSDLIGLQDGYYGESNNRDRSLDNEVLLTASRKELFGLPINANLSIGGASWNRSMHGITAHSGTWYYPNWYSLGNYTPTTYGQDSAGNTIVITKGDDPSVLVPVNNYYDKKINSVYGFLNLSYKDYLFLEFTGRNDWSSTLPANANSYFYPGVSVSFIATDALDISSNTFSFCKVRGGVAQTATDTDPYQTEFYYNTSLYGGQQASSYPSVIPPISLEPQRVNSYEIGTNLGFLKDRITLDFTYYYKYSFDQILKTPLPVSAGSGYALINEGVLSNKGIELIVNATVFQNNDWNIKTGLNFSRNRNKVVSLGEYADTYILAEIWGENGPQIALHEGDDFGTISGWDYVYLNGQPVVNEAGTAYKISSTRVPVGNASPDFLAGWTTSFNYKGFTLTTLIDTKWGGDMYCGSYVTGLQTGQSPTTLTERDGNGLPYTDPSGNTSNIGVILPGVHEDGSQNTTVVHYYYKYLPNAGGWGHFLTKPGIVDDTWVKFREITFTYTLPLKAVKKLRVFNGLSFSF